MSDASSETKPAAPKQVQLSVEEAVQVVMPAAATLQRNWLTAAINVAGAVKAGRPVNPGTFEDLRHLREQYEEMERARLALMNADAAQKKASTATRN